MPTTYSSNGTARIDPPPPRRPSAKPTRLPDAIERRSVAVITPPRDAAPAGNPGKQQPGADEGGKTCKPRRDRERQRETEQDQPARRDLDLALKRDGFAPVEVCGQSRLFPAVDSALQHIGFREAASAEFRCVGLRPVAALAMEDCGGMACPFRREIICRQTRQGNKPCPLDALARMFERLANVHKDGASLLDQPLGSLGVYGLCRHVPFLSQ
jgi:hypothetical protein